MKGGLLLGDPQALLAYLEHMVGKEYLGTPYMVTQGPLERGVSLESRDRKDSEEGQDARVLQDQLATLDLQVSKVLKAERGVLGFQAPLVNLDATVKRDFREDRAPQDCRGLQAAQVPQVGKEIRGIGAPLDQLG